MKLKFPVNFDLSSNAFTEKDSFFFTQNKNLVWHSI